MESIYLKLFLTAVFVFLNGFFVAAEFALVKTRPSRVAALVATGDKSAIRLQVILDQLDLYLSACQLGITIASLVLGYLAEPAFAALIEVGAVDLVGVAPDSDLLHVIAFGAALVVVTVLHMVLGEQAPKVWAIDAAERAALRFALPVRVFTLCFKPLIVIINWMSNALLRVLGLSGGHDEHSHDLRELKSIIGAAAGAGNISGRQRLFAENILDLVHLEVRHVMIPRTEVSYLLRSDPLSTNLDKIRNGGHSRWPLCDGDLDGVRGVVIVRDLLEHALGKSVEELEGLDLLAIARKTMFVPDTQPLSRFIVESQQTGQQGALVLDEHGTVVGMTFLEDALEEIVGPLRDERDPEGAPTEAVDETAIEMAGSVGLPEAVDRLGLEADDSDDTIGGYVVARLGRLPRRGDELRVGNYRATVLEIGKRRRVERIRFEPVVEEEDEEPED
ncbi:MAG: HlyC/CorC family transporter [Sandaracinaceae bacterium]|nr:HlyC/CorC family transporter [Sandaracinaceae bacterium]